LETIAAVDVALVVRGVVIGFSIAAPVGPIGVLCIRRTLAREPRSVPLRRARASRGQPPLGRRHRDVRGRRDRELALPALSPLAVASCGLRQRPPTRTIRSDALPKITPFLWYDKEAEEAATFYCSVFKNSKIHHVARYPEGSPAPAGSVMTVEFDLDGQRFIALNAGPHFTFNEAVSFVIDCDTQAEVDHYWSKLTSDGGQESMCGWLKDKYGLSWQVTPKALTKLMSDPDKEKAKRVMQAMMRMRKIDIAELEEAAVAI
jgi:predicted 3-demethylubiquinone-9 3-methyltransferase (glyoxalase superfamily)